MTTAAGKHTAPDTPDPATLAQKFDRWWAEQGLSPDSPANLAKRWLEAAYVAGAAAERIECVRRLQRTVEPADELGVWLQRNPPAGVMKRRDDWFPREDMGAPDADD